MSQEIPTTPFITFYSFKGGVGRSMALINTAAILAGRGFRVLVIDLDLEAPGLSYLARGHAPTPALQPGFIDLLADAKERGADADLFAQPPARIAELYTRPYILPDGGPSSDGWLHIMPAGKLDNGYTKRFDDLNLRELYEDGLGEPLIRVFKKKFAEHDLYDYVLIDSRTGFSDEAGICTRDLADYLMVLSGLNNQNIEGTGEFLKALKGETEGKARFQIILSPVPNGEDDLFDVRLKKAQETFSAAWGQNVDLSLQIPYHPRLALTEEPHVFHRRSGYLFEAYRAIEKRMLDAIGHDVKALMPQIKAQLEKEDYAGALYSLNRLKRLDDANDAMSNFLLALVLALKSSAQKTDPAQRQATLSLDKILSNDAGRNIMAFLIEHIPCEPGDFRTYFFLDQLQSGYSNLAGKLHQRLVDANPMHADVLGNYAVFLEIQQDDLNGAEAFYKRAVEADPKHANNLGNYANFLENQRGDQDGAEAHYRRALEADPKHTNNLGNYANFLENQRGDMDGAEAHYRRALEADPKDVRSLGIYANFLANQWGDLDGAEALYRRAIEADPKHANSLGNYGQFLVGKSRAQEGEQSLLLAIEHVASSKISELAEFCFSLWLTTRMQDRDANRWHQGFKFYIQQGFKRFPWTFDRMLAQAKKILAPAEFTYAQALATAFLDPEKVAALDQFEQWRTLEPQPIK
jgi:Tfp pilus assembly protein PilF/cellulose biosynthesis protein BcsQ